MARPAVNAPSMSRLRESDKGHKGNRASVPGVEPRPHCTASVRRPWRRHRDPASHDRGIMPDRHRHRTCQRAQRMMVTRWLDHARRREVPWHHPGVSPDDVAGAKRSTDTGPSARGGSGVPLQSRELCGKPPVLAPGGGAAGNGCGREVHRGGAGIQFPPTPSGEAIPHLRAIPPSMALNYLYHYDEHDRGGVFERMPALKFVWADGAIPTCSRRSCSAWTASAAHWSRRHGRPDAQRLPARSRLFRARCPRRAG